MTTPTPLTTDFRALCAELVEELAAETTLYPGYEREIVTRTRAALAELQTPTDEEVAEALKTLRLIPIDPENGITPTCLDTARRALEQLND